MKNPGWLAGMVVLGMGLGLAAQPPQLPPRLEQGGSALVSAVIPEDPDLERVIAPLAAQIQASFGRVLATAPQGMERTTGPGEFPLGFFVADVMRTEIARAVPGVRIAFTNSGGLRRDLPAGPVRVAEVYEVIPFDDEVVVAEYTGAEVVAILKEAIQHRGGEPVSGLRVSLAGSAGQPRGSFTWSDGTAIDPAGVYRIATSDYLLANGDATPTLKQGRRVIHTSIPLRQMVIDFCERQGRAGQPILAPEGGRYRFSPDIAAAIQARTFHF